MSKIGDIRVVGILEIDKIVINKGQLDKIQSYMEFLVYSEGLEIVDPVTNVNLGMLENPKGKFKPMHIQDRMTILVSKIGRQKSSLSLLLPSFEIDTERDIMKTIKLGDKVKIINELK